MKVSAAIGLCAIVLATSATAESLTSCEVEGSTHGHIFQIYDGSDAVDLELAIPIRMTCTGIEQISCLSFVDSNYQLLLTPPEKWTDVIIIRVVVNLEEGAFFRETLNLQQGWYPFQVEYSMTCATEKV